MVHNLVNETDQTPALRAGVWLRQTSTRGELFNHSARYIESYHHCIQVRYVASFLYVQPEEW